ncbi:hypothetical protein JCM10212_002178 [Sporobolomyces blumeae]
MAYGSLPSRHPSSRLGFFSSRSVSDPFAASVNNDSTTPHEPLPSAGLAQEHTLGRRNSIDSLVDRKQQQPKKHHHHFKALRDKFQALASGGAGGGSTSKKADQQRTPTRASTASPSPKKLSRNGGPRGQQPPPKIVMRDFGGPTGLKGFAGPGGADGRDIEGERANGGLVKSLSLPSITGRTRSNSDRRRSPLPLEGGQLSVDAFLANTTTATDASPLAPASASGLPSPPLSPSRPPRTSSIALAPRRPQTAENLSPTSQRLPVFNRISSDFARPVAAPPLSTLRARQIRETQTLASNRHSRILPGATLPASFPQVDPERPFSRLSRSFSAGPTLNGEQRRTRRPSAQSGSSSNAPSVRSSKVASVVLLPNGLPKHPPADEARYKDDLAYRRHSLSPVVTAALANQSPNASPDRRRGESEPVASPAKPEDQRGTTLSNILGGGGGSSGRKPSIGLGFSSFSSSSGGGGLERRRPSKPFPGGFEEVPFQNDGTPAAPQRAIDNPSTVSALEVKPKMPWSPNPSLNANGTVAHRRGLKAISIAPRQSPSPAIDPSPTILPPPVAISPNPRTRPRPPSLVPDFNPFPKDGTPLREPVFPVLPGRAGRPNLRPRKSSSELVTLALKRKSRERLSPPSDRDEQGSRRSIRRSRSETELWTPSSASFVSEIEQDRLNYFGEGGGPLANGGGEPTVGGYAARLRELRAMRTPVLGPAPDGTNGLEKRVSRLEMVDPDDGLDAQRSSSLGSRRRTLDDRDPEDESRPVSPTHFKASPGAEHPFRLSTYLEYLPLATPKDEERSSSLVATVPLATTEPLSIISPLSPTTPSRISNQEDSVVSPGAVSDAGLTLAQMEEEISKMERELALAGTPRSFFTDDHDTLPDLSPSASRSFGGLGGGGGLPSSEMSSDPNSPFNENSFITPRTARKWSIVEIERAYERMKRMLGSSSSSRIYAPSEADRESQLDANNVLETQGRNRDEAKEPDADEQEVLRGTDRDVFSSTNVKREPASPPTAASIFSQQASPSLLADMDRFKPLPGIPPPSPSRRVEMPTSSDRPRTPPARPKMVDSAVGRSPKPSRQDSDESIVHDPMPSDSTETLTTSLNDLAGPASGIETASEDGTVKGFSTPPTSPIGAISRPFGVVSPGGSGRRSRLSTTGTLRSGAGRELQRLANGDDADESTETLGDPPSRQPSRLNTHRLVPPTDPPRRRELLRSADSNSWYPSTPGRRTRASTSESGLSERGDSRLGVLPSDDGSDYGSASTARPELAEIRKLDKLEIFFKYTAVKADLEKAEIERDALYDALSETRETLADVRRQRDKAQAELERERQFAFQVKEHLGGDPDTSVDKLDNLVASRAAWQQRAQEALDELVWAREELEKARRELRETRGQPVDLDEDATAGRAPSAAGRRSPLHPTAVSPSQATSRVASPLGISSPRLSKIPIVAPRPDAFSPNGSIDSGSGSPTMTLDQINLRGASTPLNPPSSIAPSRPKNASTLEAAERHRRVVSTHSVASSFGGGGLEGIAEMGSPLMSQTMAFGPKSSYGSNDSPVKPSMTNRPMSFPPLLFGGRPASSAIPFPTSTTTSMSIPSVRRGSKLSNRSVSSTGNSEPHDLGERSFDSTSSVPQTEVSQEGDEDDENGLKRRDAAFLDDLTHEIPQDVLDEQNVSLHHLIKS